MLRLRVESAVSAGVDCLSLLEVGGVVTVGFMVIDRVVMFEIMTTRTCSTMLLFLCGGRS